VNTLTERLSAIETRTGEKWVPIDGYPNYEVSSHGRVLSKCKGKLRILASLPNMYGYYRYGLSNGKKTHTFFVHHLVLNAFGPPRGEGQICRHLDGVRTNNRIENLKWGTLEENCMDAFIHGTMPKGERHGCAKLREAEVQQIKKNYKRTSGRASNCRELAIKYGVSRSTIQRIVFGKNWTDRIERLAGEV
jgi:hypothetical protein